MLKGYTMYCENFLCLHFKKKNRFAKMCLNRFLIVACVCVLI